MRICPFKAARLNERSALVARECRRNLMHEMDGMLEAWLGHSQDSHRRVTNEHTQQIDMIILHFI